MDEGLNGKSMERVEKKTRRKSKKQFKVQLFGYYDKSRGSHLSSATLLIMCPERTTWQEMAQWQYNIDIHTPVLHFQWCKTGIFFVLVTVDCLSLFAALPPAEWAWLRDNDGKSQSHLLHHFRAASEHRRG